MNTLEMFINVINVFTHKINQSYKSYKTVNLFFYCFLCFSYFIIFRGRYEVMMDFDSFFLNACCSNTFKFKTK